MMRNLIIDIHAHYYPETYLAVLEKHGYPAGTVYAAADPRAGKSERIHSRRDPAFTDLELRVAEMDRQAVGMHAASIPPPYIFARDSGLLTELSRAYNDGVSAAHRAYPERIVGLASLPVQDPAFAIAELERAAQLPGIRGVGLGTRFGEHELSDPAFFPLYERIQALELPIFLHYAPMTVIGQYDRLRQFHLANLIGNATETAIAAAHLVFGGVLDAFPSLEICLPHSGGVLPILIGRLDRGFRVRQECNHLPHPPSHYLRRFSYDTVCHSTQIMSFLLRMVGADRMVLGSDYCFDMGYDRPVDVVDELKELSSRDRAMILGGNAARLLRI